MKSVIGVIVVHGIGTQKKMDTVKGMVSGLMTGFNLPEPKEESDYLELDLGSNRLVRLYEVYWAGELTGKKIQGSFKFSILPLVSWFPGFNANADWYPEGAYSAGHVTFRKWLLVLFTVPIWLLIKGADYILSTLVNPFVLNLYFRREVDLYETLDDTAGDVVNYIKSRAGTHYDKAELAHVAKDICSQFYRKIRLALDQGCTEIQIVAHSLGTLVAYDVITGSTLKDEPRVSNHSFYPFEKLSRMYTFGSPLEKIFFFWPKLLKTKIQGPVTVLSDNKVVSVSDQKSGILQENFSWVNFYHKCDLVAGKLIHFDHWVNVKNCSLKRNSGILRSHNQYYFHPKVHEVMGVELLQMNPNRLSGRHRLFNCFGVVLENIIAVLIFALLLLFGTFNIVITWWIIVYLINLPLRLINMSKPVDLEGLFGWSEPPNDLCVYFAIVLIVGWVLWYFKNNKGKAIKEHPKYR